MTDPVEKWTFSKWKSGGISLSLFANVCCMLGLLSTAWAVTANKKYDPNYEGLGLWRFCASDASQALGHETSCHDTSILPLPGWFVTTQATVTSGFILLFSALVVLVVGECVKACRPRTSLVITFLFISLVSVALLVTGVAIFGVEIENLSISLITNEQQQQHGGNSTLLNTTNEPLQFKVSWSYILCAVASGLQLFAMIVAGCDIICKRTSSDNEPEVEMQNPSQTPTSGPTDVRYQHF